jgi:hypothetical protein
MAKVGVQRASELTGKSKSTIQRALKTGKLSYEVDDKKKLIDVSELERVFGVEMAEIETVSEAKTTPSYEVELQQARHALEVDRLEMKVKLLEDQIDVMTGQMDDLKAQRDSWQKQAQQVLLTSQHSQEQADARIKELQKREEARARAIQLKKQQEAQRRMDSAASNQNVKNHSFLHALFVKKDKKKAS